jgi:hypothetical protein
MEFLKKFNGGVALALKYGAIAVALYAALETFSKKLKDVNFENEK